jgi:hypothetical protein
MLWRAGVWVLNADEAPLRGKTNMAEQRGLRSLSRADVLVAAIICLLLILLVPVLFARPREQSIRKTCAANLAQIGKDSLLVHDPP